MIMANKGLTREGKFTLLALAIMILVVLFVLHTKKTAAIEDEIKRFMNLAAVTDSELVWTRQGAGLGASFDADYLMPKTITNAQIYTHYCTIMDGLPNWKEASELLGDYPSQDSTCAEPWKDKKIKFFSFTFCDKSNKVFHLSWYRVNGSVYPVDRKISISMFWRPDAPSEYRCKKWVE